MQACPPMQPEEQGRHSLFWLAAATLVLLRLALTSDLSVRVTYGPWDDTLYVKRAYHLLAGEAFGPYDGRILGKFPGLSLWLAAVRTLGVPFLISINAIYVGAGLYFSAALLHCGLSRWLVFAALAMYLFNPVTFGIESIRVIREPLATGLFVLMLAAIAHMLVQLREGRRPWAHLAVFASVFAFALFVREDDRALWALLAIFLGVLAWHGAAWRRPLAAGAAFLATATFVSAALALAFEHSIRSFVERHYGLPILHEFAEGEYPRLLAAIRGIRTTTENRMVMVSQEALEKLSREAPSTRPVVGRLPKPGAATLSCELHGVCREWSNGWMPFMVKDEAFHAGLTPSLVAGQDYFRRVRDEIERACAERRLQCADRGQGLIPPMELRWTRAYVTEGWRIARLAIAPDNNAVREVPLTYEVPVQLGRLVQAVTMTDYFDTQLQEKVGEREGSRLYVNVLAGARAVLTAPYQGLAAVLIVAAALALAARLWRAERSPPGPLALLASIFAAYTLCRLLALTYVAVFMGGFTPRLLFSTYAAATLLAIPVIAEASRALRRAPRTLAAS